MTAALRLPWRWKRSARGTLYLFVGNTHNRVACVFPRDGMYGWWVRGVPKDSALCGTEEQALEHVYLHLGI
jgi:hypothetical protein